MGRRVSLAALAEDDVYEPGPEAKVAQLPEPIEAAAAAPAIEVSSDRTVPLATVCGNPLNKRQDGVDDQLQEMAETIRAHGVIQPLVVCSSKAYLSAFPQQFHAVGSAAWVVLIGNRRLRAASLAALDEVPIVVNDDQVASMYEVMLVENGQRRELPPAMEAEAMSEALQASGLSQAELARRIGKSAMYISHRLALLDLIPELRELLDAGALKLEDARSLGTLPKAEQRDLFEAGPPYRRKPQRTSSTPRTVTIRVSSPAVAADSIRSRFNVTELAELVSLLSQHLKESEAAEASAS